MIDLFKVESSFDDDSSALAAAQTGFAMGAVGTETAMDAADIVIMDDDPLRIVETIEISQRTMNILWQNIYLAIFIKGTFLILTALNQTSMWMAVFSDMGTSLLVICNSLRLSRQVKNNNNIAGDFPTE